MGVKELSPAYLDPTLKPEDLLTGVNFASGGCGYDPLTTRLSVHIRIYYTLYTMTNIIYSFGKFCSQFIIQSSSFDSDFFQKIQAAALSLSDQLQLFKEYIDKLRAIVGEEGKNRIFETSFFLVVVGSNDINNNYFGSRIRRLQYDISTYTDLLVGHASTFLKVTRRVYLFEIV